MHIVPLPARWLLFARFIWIQHANICAFFQLESVIVAKVTSRLNGQREECMAIQVTGLVKLINKYKLATKVVPVKHITAEIRLRGKVQFVMFGAVCDGAEWEGGTCSEVGFNLWCLGLFVMAVEEGGTCSEADQHHGSQNYRHHHLNLHHCSGCWLNTIVPNMLDKWPIVVKETMLWNLCCEISKEEGLHKFQFWLARGGWCGHSH